MDKHSKHTALDDYFASMLSVPVVEDVKPSELTMALTDFPQAELKPLLSVVSPQGPSDFKMPEPDSSGSLTELDLLLGSVIDIDLADMDLSVLDNAQSAYLPAEPVIDTMVGTISAAEQEIQRVVADVTVAEMSESTVLPEAELSPSSIPEADTETELESNVEAAPTWKNVELEERFQALFFEVAGVTFAVPLTELGGIHQAEVVNSLFGKPDWYLGIMQHREQKLSVVDTAQWVMPEQNMGEIDYKYQIQLSESNWVLGCESLHGTETLNSNDIKWRSTPGSRPWLAGMVKSRMCVLLHVTEMIKLLDNGINIHGQ
ncbi:chemotaxis protein CheW [Moritella sp.]|uniref:chemotaxis protein CheW n=1 Tax=Moritella sp. TaxID=78556 RepID=UPI001DCF3D15|nr:chemotaxis protein CheW [Moritella sp.]MCJ8348462.1 chemotaxis protein CheW [Moritella sp.]NQZ38979.1 chemotaxis protein CheW [Moritella sp.]